MTEEDVTQELQEVIRLITTILEKLDGKKEESCYICNSRTLPVQYT